MPSIVTYSDGLRRIEFSLSANGPRRTLRLGRASAKVAAAVPQPAGEPGNRADARVRPGDRLPVDRQLAGSGGAALRRFGGPGFGLPPGDGTGRAAKGAAVAGCQCGTGRDARGAGVRRNAGIPQGSHAGSTVRNCWYNRGMGGKGLEHPTESPGKTALAKPGGAESGARGAPEGRTDTRADPDLAAVIHAWPALPDVLKAGILAMVRASADASTANGVAP